MRLSVFVGKGDDKVFILKIVNNCRRDISQKYNFEKVKMKEENIRTENDARQALDEYVAYFSESMFRENLLARTWQLVCYADLANLARENFGIDTSLYDKTVRQIYICN